ncbi:MAG TPA: hypothetical protein PLB89_05085 [Flavobacteriales bacterium]|nr:hypothetical protein [Flavobacteriales bacterium]
MKIAATIFQHSDPLVRELAEDMKRYVEISTWSTIDRFERTLIDRVMEKGWYNTARVERADKVVTIEVAGVKVMSFEKRVFVARKK